AITDICSRINNQEPRPLGEYRGFKTEIGFDGMNREFFINLKGALTHKVLLGKEIGRIVLRIDNQIEKFAERKANNETQLAEYHRQVENAKIEIAKPFADEAILEEKSRRLDELNAELNMDRKENEIVDGAEEISEDGQDKKPTSRDDRDDR
ncbi:MAG: helicase, partial [Clostridia bacterium]|nr:helicase [Clostridia bacterium]